MEDYWRKLGEIYRVPGAPEAPPGNREPTQEPQAPPARRQATRPPQGPPPPKPALFQGIARPPAARRRLPDEDERAARRTLWFLALGAGALVLGLVVSVTVHTLRTEGPNAGRTAVTTPEDAAKVVGGLGPPHGTDVDAYITARKNALTQATGDRLAVVSLARYATEADARAIVGRAEVVALLVAAPGGQPSVVTGDMAAWAEAETAEARAERDEIQRLIPTAKDDPAFQSFYRSEVDRLTQLVSAVRPDGDLVFALVVRAPAAELRQLTGHPDVRLVDVAPGAQASPETEFRGLRPEEASKANEPNTRPL